MQLIKNAVTYNPVEIWKVELQEGFTINVVWLKKTGAHGELEAMFGDEFVSAVKLSTGKIDPIHLIYDGSST